MDIARRLAVAAISVATHAACRAGAAPTPRADVVFFEDFTTTSLDRSRWTVRTTGPTYNDEQQAYVDDSTTLSVVPSLDTERGVNGVLVIRARSRPGFTTPQGKRFDFVSGRMDTRGKVEFTYGRAAARMRLPAGAGLWPAFWALGAGPWPATGEIDVMENVGDPSWTSVALHGPGYSGNTPIVRRASFPAGQDATGWHVYSVDWAPDSIVFRVDDREIYRVTRAIVAPYGRWAFDNPKFLILNLALGGGYPRDVNKTTVPYVGLPDSTVRRIRSDSVAVLVDWVRVTRR
jgi:beta-glucanase (GH16 family)